MIKNWFKKNWKMVAIISALVAAIVLLGVVATRPQEPVVVSETITLETVIEKTYYVEKEIVQPDYEYLLDTTVVIVREFGLTTGVIISEDGYILSCAHSHGAVLGIYVRTEFEGLKLFPLNIKHEGRIVYEWPEGDLALYKVDLDRPLPYAKIAKTIPDVGGDVVAMGTPLGFPGYISWGKVITNLHMPIGLNLILSDCAGNAGNSGGPLFNTAGELVGINIALLAALPGMGFYIPVLDGMVSVQLTQVEPMIWAIIHVDKELNAVQQQFEVAKEIISSL